MARITIEDCTEKVPNRFHLVQMAAIRAKQLKLGANALVGTEDNKSVVIALREIAAGRVLPDYAEGTEEYEAQQAAEQASASE
jgi:DNA-directed RNA polymerase subunit omega